MTTYLEEIRVQRGVPITLALEPIRSWEVWTEMSHLPRNQLPAVVVMSPGTIGEPTKDGEGWVYATWRIAVGVVSTAKDAIHARMNSKQYAAAVRAILSQRQSLAIDRYADSHNDAMAVRVDFVAESYDETPIESEETLGVSTVVFDIEVAEVVNIYGGPIEEMPPEPDPIPGSDWPEVLTTYLNIINVSLNKDVTEEEE